MFEIRVICDPADTDRVTATLVETFTTGAVRCLPSRSSDKERLYVTAEHREDNEQWPTPEQAYAKAPSIISEIGWTAQRAREALWPIHSTDMREFWLRKAALLDRIAMDDRTAGIHTDVPDLATETARHLMDLDDATAICDPRAYVRQQYALWASQQ